MNLVVGLVFIGVLTVLVGISIWSKKRPPDFLLNRPVVEVFKLAFPKLPIAKALKPVIILAIFLSILLIFYLTWYVPIWLSPTDPLAQTENRKAFIQLLAGIAILFTAYFTWQRMKIADKQALAANRQIMAMEDGQITERYTKAIEQLGNENITIRIGGIFALERIAKDSVKRGDHRDYHTVMEVLAGFIREKSPLEVLKDTKSLLPQESEEAQASQQRKGIAQDIQAALTVIGRRELEYGEDEDRPVDLSRCNLKVANFQMAGLKGAFLMDSNLEKGDFLGANLQEAHLRDARLFLASLIGTNLQGAHLQGANLQECKLVVANLQGANLKGADLQKAEFHGANLQGAYLEEAKLQDAKLGGVNLEGAFLQGAFLQGAILNGADLRRTDLRGANLQDPELQKFLVAAAELEEVEHDEVRRNEFFYRWNHIKNGANLQGADLREAIFDEETIVTWEQLSEVKSLSEVEGLPEELEKRLREAKPELFEKPELIETDEGD